MTHRLICYRLANHCCVIHNVLQLKYDVDLGGWEYELREVVEWVFRNRRVTKLVLNHALYPSKTFTKL